MIFSGQTNRKKISEFYVFDKDENIIEIRLIQSIRIVENEVNQMNLAGSSSQS